ncbi:MAG: sigma-70 family RNA polymerase sigma factor [Ignavibacteriaceae bacterium]|nr:sigma-70 family RNA polymerase sigma factor [Ignavibacteriaceae bacterium]
MGDKQLKNFTDEELILEFQLNNTVKAYELLVQRYKNPLFNFIFKYLNDYEGTEDVVQETMIKVYINKDSYKTIAKFSTWIYTIASNLAITELKKRKRRNQISINSYGENDETMDLPGTNHSPEEITDSGIKSKIIMEALQKLPEVYREVVILRDIQELSYEEIAEIKQISVGTVKSRINRGRTQLQIMLKHIYKE